MPDTQIQTADRLRVDPALLRSLLVDFLREEIGKFGFQRAVVGLSGGVDSSLSLFLTAEALGKENATAVLLPYGSAHEGVLDDAMLMVETLGVPHHTIDIAPLCDVAFQAVPEMTRVRRGNVMARVRMTLLYDQSAEVDGLVVGTSNKSEMLLGYGTLYGDMAWAVNPLGDLYKTQVWQLARAWGLPSKIVDKVPTADLWPGQTDEGELGFPYAVADQILYLLVDERYLAEEVVALGFDEATVESVWERMRKNHFKRVPPVVAKVSRRTVGHDFLYERDWGQ
ncbi:MAG: NAD+ synthase [Anaerolineae bacterium]